MRLGMDESPVIFEADCIADTSSAETSGLSRRTMTSFSEPTTDTRTAE